MADIIFIEFAAIGKRVQIQLDPHSSPNTVREVMSKLPILVNINRWGNELYTEPTQVTAVEENPVSEVNINDFAYWPEGKALCLFYGKTPISKGGKILPYSPVNIIGKIITSEENTEQFLDAVESSQIRKKIPVFIAKSTIS